MISSGDPANPIIIAHFDVNRDKIDLQDFWNNKGPKQVVQLSGHGTIKVSNAKIIYLQPARKLKKADFVFPPGQKWEFRIGNN